MSLLLGGRPRVDVLTRVRVVGGLGNRLRLYAGRHGEVKGTYECDDVKMIPSSGKRRTIISDIPTVFEVVYCV
jgi:hypothetical protein